MTGPHAIDDQRVSMLVKDIESVGDNQEIRIFAGEGNCHVYNREEVYNALTGVKTRGVKARMILGPVFCVPDNDNRGYLRRLVEEDAITVYYRPYRFQLPHYRVFTDRDDSLKIYLEEPHPSMIPGKAVENADENVWARKYYADFDEFIKIYELEVVKDIASRFLLWTPAQIETVCILAREENLDYDFLGKDELLKLQKRAEDERVWPMQ